MANLVIFFNIATSTQVFLGTERKAPGCERGTHLHLLARGWWQWKDPYSWGSKSWWQLLACTRHKSEYGPLQFTHLKNDD